MVQYKITIEKITTDKAKVTEWEKVYEADVYKELVDSGKIDAEKIEQYQYKEITKEIEKAEKIFEQIRDVEKFDMMGVINSFNK